MITQHSKVLGSDAINSYIKKYNILIKSELKKLVGTYPPVSFNSFVRSKNKMKANPDAIDLLQKMLVVDH